MDGVSVMYRVIAIAGAALTLAACSSTNNNLSQYFSDKPVLETVRFEFSPPGAEAKTSLGQACTTPCALALPGGKPFTVAFTLTGFKPGTENVQPFSMGDGTTQLRPNPVTVELAPVSPPKKMRKRRKVIHHKRAVKHEVKRVHKPVAHKPPTAKPAPAPAAPPPQAAPAPAPSSSPWPAPSGSK